MNIDHLVNNAGVGLAGPVAAAAEERLAAMVRLNCEALTTLTRHFLPRCRARSRRHHPGGVGRRFPADALLGGLRRDKGLCASRSRPRSPRRCARQACGCSPCAGSGPDGLPGRLGLDPPQQPLPRGGPRRRGDGDEGPRRLRARPQRVRPRGREPPHRLHDGTPPPLPGRPRRRPPGPPPRPRGVGVRPELRDALPADRTPGHVRGDARRDLVVDRADPGGHLLGRDCRFTVPAEKRHLVVGLDAGHVGDVNHRHVHGHAAADRRALAAHERVGRVGESTIVAVVVADRAGRRAAPGAVVW